ncbi:proactivator polypeptide-like 1 [Sciurus carolinensis]|uniref:proactivator polypeptide-like 1 n=1 Tax=Sciurus carolinensis TaxID=30640 RepID=UPI001FB40598|nr:proactivator polypeptide-like 1 [Sciurus carolinensis]
MLCALLLLSGLLGAMAGPVSGPQDCAKGPEVWCHDLQAAARCRALGHCQRSVWSKPTAKSLPCDVCQEVVAAAGNGLNPDASESDVLAWVTKTCEWLPSQESSAWCKETVDTHSTVVLSMLRSGPASPAAQVCTALTLCEPLQRRLAAPGVPFSREDASQAATPFVVNGALSFHPPQGPGGAVCQECVQLVSRLQDAQRSNWTWAGVNIQEHCASLGPGLALLCKGYVHQLSVPAEQALRLLPPQEVCRKGGFCEELRAPAHRPAQAAAVDGVPSLERGLPRRSEIQMKSGLTCEVCLDVIQELDQWLVANSTEAMISRALERVCSIMPASILQECVTLVDTYSPSLVQMVSRVAPERVCKAIRLCSSRRWARAAPGVRATRAHATEPSLLLDEESQGSFCNGCKRLLGVSSQNLERKSTKRDILTAFKGGCSILPLPYMVQCNRFVTEYEPVLIESLKEVMDPEAVCRKVGACHAARTPLLGTDQCVLGPSFWCRSPATAELCNAVDHCQRLVWKGTPRHSRGHL